MGDYRGRKGREKRGGKRTGEIMHLLVECIRLVSKVPREIFGPCIVPLS